MPEIEGGKCKAVGLIGGPVYNQPVGLVWLDIDGPTIYPLIEELSGKAFDEAVPSTLTIQSGKEGRERRLFIVKKDNWDLLVRNKYRWYSEEKTTSLSCFGRSIKASSWVPTPKQRGTLPRKD